MTPLPPPVRISAVKSPRLVRILGVRESSNEEPDTTFATIEAEANADARAEVAVPRRGWMDSIGAGGER